MFSELTSTPLVVWSFCWRYVVWTTSKLCIETTSFLVGSMSWVHQIITAAPLGIFAWSGIITAFEIQSLSSGDSIWTATILSQGTILVLTDENHPQPKIIYYLIDFSIFIWAPLKLRSSSSILQIRTTTKLSFLTRITNKNFLWTGEASLLLGSLRECPKKKCIKSFQICLTFIYLPSGQQPNLPA